MSASRRPREGEARVTALPFRLPQTRGPHLPRQRPRREHLHERAVHLSPHRDPARVARPPGRAPGLGQPLQGQHEARPAPARAARGEEDRPARRQPRRHASEEGDALLPLRPWAGAVVAVSGDRLDASDDAFAAGHLDEAATAARSAAAAEPWSAEPWLRLATVEQAAGNLEAAQLDLRRAIELNPALLVAHLNLAFALSRSGDIEEARAHLEIVLAREPGNRAARHWMDEIRAGRIDPKRSVRR